MSEPKFTQGEWTWDDDFRVWCGNRLVADYDQHACADESAANAALGAAAPQLYAACEVWLALKHGPMSEAEHNALATMRAALRAARYSPLTTDLTAREVNAQRTEADRDFH